MLRFITLCIPHKTTCPSLQGASGAVLVSGQTKLSMVNTTDFGSGVRRDRHAVSPVSMFIYYSPVHRHGQEVFTYMRRQLTGGITI